MALLDSIDWQGKIFNVGGVAASGTGSRLGGGPANIEAFTETRWITMRGEPAQYPF